MEHIDGDKYIQETLLGLKFRISPTAFFQINTAGAEVLYTTLGNIINVQLSTTLLDICCGTGTIGLYLAKVLSIFIITYATTLVFEILSLPSLISQIVSSHTQGWHSRNSGLYSKRVGKFKLVPRESCLPLIHFILTSLLKYFTVIPIALRPIYEMGKLRLFEVLT